MRRRIVVIVLCLGALVIMPEISTRAARLALETWALRVVPAMFPYMVLARLLARTAVVSEGKRSRKAAMRRVALTGWTAGNPVGACVAGVSAQAGVFSTEDALHAALLGSACSPAFILGALGDGHGNAGLLLLVSHWLGIVCGSVAYKWLDTRRMLVKHRQPRVAACLSEPINVANRNKSVSELAGNAYQSEPVSEPTRNVYRNEPVSEPTRNVYQGEPVNNPVHATYPHETENAPTRAAHLRTANPPIPRPSTTSMDIAAESAQTMLTIGGYMVLATVAAAYMQLLLLMLVPGVPAVIGATLHSVLEMAGGTLSLMTLYPARNVLPLVALALALGGLSITLQSLAMLRPAGVTPGRYIMGKLIQGAFAYVICAALEPVFCAGATGADWETLLKRLGAGAIATCAIVIVYARVRSGIVTRRTRNSAPLCVGRADI